MSCSWSQSNGMVWWWLCWRGSYRYLNFLQIFLGLSSPSPQPWPYQKASKDPTILVAPSWYIFLSFHRDSWLRKAPPPKPTSLRCYRASAHSLTWCPSPRTNSHRMAGIVTTAKQTPANLNLRVSLTSQLPALLLLPHLFYVRISKKPPLCFDLGPGC